MLNIYQIKLPHIFALLNILMNMDQLCVLYNEKVQEANEKYEAVLKCRQPLRDRYSQLGHRRVELEAKFSACAELNGNVKAAGKDKIKLNVGGVRVVATRSTLTLFPDSKLARLFSGRWDKKLQRDKENRIFLDVDPVCFKAILGHLKLCLESTAASPLLVPEVPEDQQSTFAHLCTVFGIFPEDKSGSAGKPRDDKAGDVHVGGVVTNDDIVDACDALKAVLKEERSMLDLMEQAQQEDERRFVEE